MNSQSKMPARMQLIVAGIKVIEEYGIDGFTMRKLASECGVSIAAPYRHFKDKDEIICAIIRYINEQWHVRQNVIIERFYGDVKKQLIEISVDYIRFLIDNPHFRHILTINDGNITPQQQKEKAKISVRSQQLIDEYCASVGMSEERRRIKTFIVRSLIYGAALMMDNGELSCDENTFASVRETITREFALN